MTIASQGQAVGIHSKREKDNFGRLESKKEEQEVDLRKRGCLTRIGCSKARGGALAHDLAVQPPSLYNGSLPCAAPDT